MNTGAREWDAETYDAVSDPQFEWGDGGARAARAARRRDRRSTPAAAPAAVTAELLERLPEGRVIAVDGSEAMVEKAKRARSATAPTTCVADLAELELAEPVDLVFSTATFHWITDHDALFARLRAALRPAAASSPSAAARATSPSTREAIAAVAADPSTRST